MLASLNCDSDASAAQLGVRHTKLKRERSMSNDKYEDLFHIPHNPNHTRRQVYSLNSTTKQKLLRIIEKSPSRWFPIPFWITETSLETKLKYLSTHVEALSVDDRCVVVEAYEHVFKAPLTPEQTVMYRTLAKKIGYGFASDYLRLV